MAAEVPAAKILRAALPMYKVAMETMEIASSVAVAMAAGYGGVVPLVVTETVPAQVAQGAVRATQAKTDIWGLLLFIIRF